MNTELSDIKATGERPARAGSGQTLEFPRLGAADEASKLDGGASCKNGVCQVVWKPSRQAS